MAGNLNFDIETYYQNGLIDRNKVKKLKQFLKDTNYPHENDNCLGVLLVFCKGNLEQAKNFAQVQYRLKSAIPEAFDNRVLDKETKDMWKIIKFALSPQLDDGSVVLLMGLKPHSIYEYNQEIAIRLFCMVMEYGCYDKPITGYRIIVDLENFSLLLLTRMNWPLVRKLLRFAGDSMANYIKCIHFVNGGYVMNQIYKIIKMFVSTYILSLFYLHDKDMDWDQFYENHISKDYLPSDYGGNLEPLNDIQEKIWEKLESMSECWQNEEKCRKMYPIQDEAYN